MRRKRRVDRLGERAHRERLREAGHALEQHVAAGEKTDEQSVDHVVLTDDASRHLPRDILHESGIRRRGGRMRRLCSLCSHGIQRVEGLLVERSPETSNDCRSLTRPVSGPTPREKPGAALTPQDTPHATPIARLPPVLTVRAV